MRLLQLTSKFSLVYKTYIVFQNRLLFACFTSMNMASDFFFQDGISPSFSVSDIEPTQFLICLIFKSIPYPTFRTAACEILCEKRFSFPQ